MMNLLAMTAIGATPALASSDPEAANGSLLALLFLGFGALIVIFQLVPSVMLFGSMLKGLFVRAENHSLSKSGTRNP